VTDYKVSRFEEQAKNIDIVFDALGGKLSNDPAAW